MRRSGKCERIKTFIPTQPSRHQCHAMPTAAAVASPLLLLPASDLEGVYQRAKSRRLAENPESSTRARKALEIHVDLRLAQHPDLSVCLMSESPTLCISLCRRSRERKKLQCQFSKGSLA